MKGLTSVIIRLTLCGADSGFYLYREKEIQTFIQLVWTDVAY